VDLSSTPPSLPRPNSAMRAFKSSSLRTVLGTTSSSFLFSSDLMRGAVLILITFQCMSVYVCVRMCVRALPCGLCVCVCVCLCFMCAHVCLYACVQGVRFCMYNVPVNRGNVVSHAEGKTAPGQLGGPQRDLHKIQCRRQIFVTELAVRVCTRVYAMYVRRQGSVAMALLGHFSRARVRR
jgi:hypothetical protein